MSNCKTLPNIKEILWIGAIVVGDSFLKKIPWGVLLGIILIATRAEGQNIPANLSPGAIIQQNRQPWAQPQDEPVEGVPGNFSPSTEAPKTTTPVQQEPQKKPPVVNSQIKVYISKIKVEGVTLIPYWEMTHILYRYRFRKLSFTDVENLATELTQLYVQAGYVNSQIYIPPQKLDNQTLILKALEVKVGKIKVQKTRWFHARAIKPRLDLKAGDYLNIQPLQRSIGIINDNPDVYLKARLEKGAESGTTDVAIDVQDRSPYHLTPFFDNLGHNGIGTLRGGFSSNINNFLGFGDKDTTSFNLTEKTHGIVNQYSFPIGPWGTELGLDYDYSHIRLGGSLAPLRVISTANVFSPSLKQVILKNDTYGLTTGLGFDIKTLNTDSLSRPLHRDRLRVLRPNLNAYYNDKYGRTFLTQEMGIGLDVLGASTGALNSSASKTGTGSKFFRYNGGVTRYQKLPWGTTGVLQTQYQMSPNRLATAEEFQAGGAFTVRGYREGAAIGDYGYVVNAEWYIPMHIFSKNAKLPFTHAPLNDACQWVLFNDIGQVLINRPVTGERRESTLIGYGTGFRLQLTKYAVVRLDIGFPLTHISPNSTARVNFGLQSSWF